MHINIGTRKSQLALWQAKHVANKLSQMGHSSQLILIESEGDKILDTPSLSLVEKAFLQKH